MLHMYQFWKQKQVMCLLCVYAVCNQHSVQACFAKKEAVLISCYVLPSPATWACTHSIENVAHVSVLEAEASHVLIMRLCSLQPTFSTSLLCKERSSLHLLLCPAQSSNMSMHALHRKCCTCISFGSRSKSCAYYAFMLFATNIQFKHALQRKKHTSIKVQKPYLKCCCKACAWNRWFCFHVRRMHLELRVYSSLTAECTLPCIASICDLSTLQCNII